MLYRMHKGWLLAATLSVGTAVVSAAVPAVAQDADADPAAEAEAPVEETEAPAADVESTEGEAEASEAETPPEAETGETAELAEPSADAVETEEVAEAAEDAAEEEQAEAPPAASGPALRFANSFFSWTNGVTAWTLDPTSGITYNPTYVMSWNLTPRFYLTDSTFLWLNQGLSVELTDSDDGAYNREPLLDDTLLDIRQLLRWEGFVFQVQGRVGFPLSKLSQASGRILQTGLGLTVTRPFPELASFTVSANFGYRRWWATRNTPRALPTENQVGFCRPTVPGSLEEPSCTNASGTSTLRDILIAGLTLTIAPADGLTVMAQGMFLWGYAHELGDAVVHTNGGPVTIPDRSVTHWRNFTYLMLAVAYDVQPWLNLQLGIQNSGFLAPLYSPDGSVRSPFSADTQLFLSATVTLDTLYDLVFGSQEEELTPEERQRRRQGLARNDATLTSF